MSNQIEIEQHGQAIVIADNYGADRILITDTEPSGPRAILAFVKNSGKDQAIDILQNAEESKRGMTIDGEFYDYNQWAAWFAEPGTSVIVAEPGAEDGWRGEFLGTIKEVKDDHMVVEDQEGDCWGVDFTQLSLES